MQRGPSDDTYNTVSSVSPNHHQHNSGDTLDRNYLKHHITTSLKMYRLPILVTERWAGVDPGVQAVSPQVTVNHPPGGRLLLLSARHAVTFTAAEHHRTPMNPDWSSKFNKWIPAYQLLKPELKIPEPLVYNSRTFQDLCLFQDFPGPGILNNKIPGLSRICTNPE